MPPLHARYIRIENAMLSLMKLFMEQKMLIESTFLCTDDKILSIVPRREETVQVNANVLFVVVNIKSEVKSFYINIIQLLRSIYDAGLYKSGRVPE